MKKILFLLMVPMLLLCTACSSDEDIDEMQSDAFVAYVYSLALRVVTPEGDNLVSTLPCVENSIELSEYKVEPITLPTKFGGNLSKWKTAEYDEFIRFIYRHTNAVDPQRNCTFKITFPKLFGDNLEHLLETQWIQDSPPMTLARRRLRRQILSLLFHHSQLIQSACGACWVAAGVTCRPLYAGCHHYIHHLAHLFQPERSG